MLSNFTTLLRMLKNSFYIKFLKIKLFSADGFFMKIFCFIPMHLMTFSIEWQAKLDFKSSIFFKFVDGSFTDIKRYWCFSCSISLTPTRYIITKNVFGKYFVKPYYEVNLYLSFEAIAWTYWFVYEISFIIPQRNYIVLTIVVSKYIISFANGNSSGGL